MIPLFEYVATGRAIPSQVHVLRIIWTPPGVRKIPVHIVLKRRGEEVAYVLLRVSNRIQ